MKKTLNKKEDDEEEKAHHYDYVGCLSRSDPGWNRADSCKHRLDIVSACALHCHFHQDFVGSCTALERVGWCQDVLEKTRLKLPCLSVTMASIIALPMVLMGDIFPKRRLGWGAAGGWGDSDCNSR